MQVPAGSANFAPRLPAHSKAKSFYSQVLDGGVMALLSIISHYPTFYASKARNIKELAKSSGAAQAEWRQILREFRLRCPNVDEGQCYKHWYSMKKLTLDGKMGPKWRESLMFLEEIKQRTDRERKVIARISSGRISRKSVDKIGAICEEEDESSDDDSRQATPIRQRSTAFQPYRRSVEVERSQVRSSVVQEVKGEPTNTQRETLEAKLLRAEAYFHTGLQLVEEVRKCLRK